MPNVTAIEEDVISNKNSVIQARSQRLLASWLPPVSKSSSKNAETDEEIEKEEAGTFKPELDNLGVGIAVAADIEEGDYDRRAISNNDKLRKQLLGNNYKKNGFSKDLVVDMGSQAGLVASKPRPVATKRAVEEDSEEEGRSGLGRPKKQHTVKKAEKDTSNSDSDASERDVKSSRTKAPSSFLDEILEKKASKKKRKKNKK